MTPADIALAMQGLELLVKLITSGIAAAQATEAERQKMLDDLEQLLDARAARIAALRPVQFPADDPANPTP